MPDGTRLAGLAADAITGIATGTHVLTDSGECRVEHLAPGDELIDADGALVTLLGIERHSHRATGTAAPVRVAVGAIGNHRALRVAPDQLVSVNGAALAARLLVDGVMADISYSGMVTYCTLVLAEDAVLIAENAPLACPSALITGAVVAPRPKVAATPA